MMSSDVLFVAVKVEMVKSNNNPPTLTSLVESEAIQLGDVVNHLHRNALMIEGTVIETQSGLTGEIIVRGLGQDRGQGRKIELEETTITIVGHRHRVDVKMKMFTEKADQGHALLLQLVESIEIATIVEDNLTKKKPSL
jgi:hypothetical protein